jgi:hypothetical protein
VPDGGAASSLESVYLASSNQGQVCAAGSVIHGSFPAKKLCGGQKRHICLQIGYKSGYAVRTGYALR